MHLGVNVIGIGQDWRSAWAVAEDDRRFSADVVVGADGYRSVARRHVAPDNPDAIFAGYALWIGMGSDDLPTRRPWPSGTTFAGDDLFPLASTPLLIPDPVTGVRTRRLTWAWTDASHNELLRELGCVTGSVVQRTLHGDEIPESDLDELAADARAHFESPWAEVIPDCIERRELIATPIAEYVPSRLVRDRVALVGDAAHVLTPMIGQGFAESLRDAEAIAAAVGARSTGGAVDGLRAYESRRLAAAREAVIAGQEISRAYVARARQAAARRRAPVGRA
jgi:2-polyprenyl-6-methoxyphenol hydroxylase-like FAD-dependent oxidoreductase